MPHVFGDVVQQVSEDDRPATGTFWERAQKLETKKLQRTQFLSIDSGR